MTARATTSPDILKGNTMAEAPFLPVVEKTDAEAPTALIFSLQEDDGSVYECRIPNRARPSLTYGYMRRVRTEGQVAAESWMMGEVLGEDGLRRLEEYEDLTPELDAAIKERITSITMGGAKAPKA